MRNRRTGTARGRGVLRSMGLGLITGAADDDCSAIGTYASAGAKFGPALLWMAPVMLPMMFGVVYLSSKLGQVAGRGLFGVIRSTYPGWILWPTLVGVLIGNVIEAGADLGGMAAALSLLVPLPAAALVPAMAVLMLAVQVLGSYALIKNTFRWLALVLFAYAGAAVLAKPDPMELLRATVIPSLTFSRDYLALVVAIVGTTLSAYLYTWQSNVEVEEKIAEGRTTVAARKGATEQELRRSRRDIGAGMLFSSLIMYSIMAASGATLHKAGHTDIETAAQAAEALRPLAGKAASLLFTLGIVAVGFLSVPVMTTGAAYDLAQAFGWKSSLHGKPAQEKRFYLTISAFTAAAVAFNFAGFNPMRALVYSGIVQGFSTPPLLLLIMLMTNNRRIMGPRVNTPAMNVLGWATTAAVLAVTGGLVCSWLL